MKPFELACPVPDATSEVVRMAHGGGGRWAQRLLDEVFLPELANPALGSRHDTGEVKALGGRLALSTDSFVVRPWRFPGGNIGSLAVHGTVNDLAMGGARALAITAAFILEEGFPLADLREAVGALQQAAARAGVHVVSGDTKVVERGKGDHLYITTSGVGEVIGSTPVGPRSVRAGDAILLSGDVGRHGAAVMSVREGLALDTSIASDSASVVEPALALIEAGIEVHCMRDPTRGGLASVLNEIARDGGVGVRLDESAVPVCDEVAGLCELFGLDPLYVACEGRFVCFVPPDQADRALDVLRAHQVSQDAVPIGLAEGRPGEVLLRSRIGIDRVLDLLSGEQLPRIC